MASPYTHVALITTFLLATGSGRNDHLTSLGPVKALDGDPAYYCFNNRRFEGGFTHS
jgi:hypothetical protein